MKKGILLAAIGVSFALTACSGQTETLVQSSVEELPVQQTQEEQMAAVMQTEEEIQAEPEQQTQEEQKETKMQQTAEAEQETETEETNVRQTDAEEETVQAKGELTQADIAVTVRGVAVAPGENMENYIGAMGEPDALSGVPSCIEEGDDKTYTYAGVLIYTYRANGTDRINLIEITGSESLVKGIHIGDTADAVIAAYGDAYTMDGDEMLYEMNDKVIGLRMADGKVTFMELFAR